MQVKLKRVSDSAILPTYGSTHAACFDLYADFGRRGELGEYNNEIPTILDRIIKHSTSMGCCQYTPDAQCPEELEVVFHPQTTLLIPTGWIFGIPEGYSLRIHNRSSLPLKQHTILWNAEGIVDADYPKETFVMLRNFEVFRLKHGDRIAQGEIVPVQQVAFEETEEDPWVQSDRIGGFGSTGS